MFLKKLGRVWQKTQRNIQTGNNYTLRFPKHNPYPCSVTYKDLKNWICWFGQLHLIKVIQWALYPHFKFCVCFSRQEGEKKHLKRLFSQSVPYSDTHFKFERVLVFAEKWFDDSGWRRIPPRFYYLQWDFRPVDYKLPKTGRSSGRNEFSWESVPQEI